MRSMCSFVVKSFPAVNGYRKANLVQGVTKITAYVLGARLDGAEQRAIGERQNVHVIPMAYETVLRKAHARTFYLKAKLEQCAPYHKLMRILSRP